MPWGMALACKQGPQANTNQLCPASSKRPFACKSTLLNACVACPSQPLTALPLTASAGSMSWPL